MNVYVFGLSHNTAPLSAVAKLTIAKERQPWLGVGLKRAFGIEELVWLSTCNRFEIYFAKKEEETDDHKENLAGKDLFKQLSAWLAYCAGHESGAASSLCYLHGNQNATTHLMRLTSGLDSMILGESQILGQVKSAFQWARENGQSGTYLSRLFSHALMVGKHVRTNTKLDQQPDSYASLAVKLALRFYRNPSRKKILMIGTGEMIERMMKHFLRKGMTNVTIAGRSHDKAARLAGSAGLNAVAIGKISAVLPSQDLVISCTASPDIVLDCETIEKSMRHRKNKLVCMIDLALPPDIDCKTKKIEGVYYYDLEHFSRFLEEKKISQTREVKEAEAVVRAQSESYTTWIKSRKFVKLVKAIQAQAGQAQQRVLNEITSKAKNKNWELDFALQELARELTKKLTLPVIERINEAAQDECNYELLRASERLYGIDAQEHRSKAKTVGNEKMENQTSDLRKKRL